jgi:putative FmdB family regulatory protein
MIYEYKCDKCQHITELWRSISDRNAPAICENCQGNARRILSSPSGINVGGKGKIPGWCTTLLEKPVYIKSKHHLRELCKKNDLRPVGLE